MRKLMRFMASVRTKKKSGMKNIPLKPVQGQLNPKRLRNKNRNYQTTYYRSARKAGYSLNQIVQHLVQADRLRADPETGIVERRKVSSGKWSGIKTRPNNRGRMMAEIYATIDGHFLRCESTLSRITYLIYHGPNSIPPDHDIDHIDEDHDNNRKNNLVPLHKSINRSKYAHAHSTVQEEYDDNPF